MTAPVTNVRVECPKCGRVYDDWYRASLNLGLDDFDEDYIRQATTATCPECGRVVELDTLVVKQGVWTFGREDERPSDHLLRKLPGWDENDPSFPQPRRPKREEER